MKTIQLDTDNIGGLLHLYAVPPSSFLRLRTDYVSGAIMLELKQRDNIIDLPMYANDTYVYTENKTTGDAGDSWEVTIEGVIPKLCGRNHPVIEELERGQWYVVAEDSNGEIHFCGQEEALMIFDSTRTSGKGAAARNETSFSFSCIQDRPTIFLTDFEEMSL